MNYVYISIEKNIEVFELFKNLWNARGIAGIRAETMTEGIKMAMEIEQSKNDELYFVDIVADDINYMPQLTVLSDVVISGPILIATSKEDIDEHHEALRMGASFYGQYCETPEQNMNAVLSHRESFDRQVQKQKLPSQLLTHGCLIVEPEGYRVYVSNTEVELTKTEFDILHYLRINKGTVLLFSKILSHVWGEEYAEASPHILRNHIKRLRQKLLVADTRCDYIENVRNLGYRFSTRIDEK